LISSLKDLRLVRGTHLILHEAHDEGRMERLRGRMEAEGELRNPVIVSPHGDSRDSEEGCFLVLDGAHRARALKELGCRLALVQIVEAPGRAESWGHLVEGIGPRELRGLEGLEVSEKPSETAVAEVRTADGEALFVCAPEGGLAAEVRALWAVQSLYPEGVVVRRVEPGEAGTPVTLAPGEALVRYRPFTPAELVEIVRSGDVLPAGITRFRVEERVLGVRYPLEKMRDGDLAVRDAELRELVEERWAENRIRYYDEPVVLFE
jgi:hypothetical protein